VRTSVSLRVAAVQIAEILQNESDYAVRQTRA
jgi:hypothetical protein